MKEIMDKLIKRQSDFLFSFVFRSTLTMIKERIEEIKKNENPDCDCGSTIDFHSSRCRATVMNKEPIKAYNQALADILSLLKKYED